MHRIVDGTTACNNIRDDDDDNNDNNNRGIMEARSGTIQMRFDDAVKLCEITHLGDRGGNVVAWLR